MRQAKDLQPRAPSAGSFVSGFPAGRIDERHRRFVARCLIDTLAASTAGANEPVSRLILAEARDGSAQSPGPGAASTWITHDAFGEEAAAFANAVIAHALDLDDVVSAVRGHVSSVLLPALIAMAEARDIHGAALADAYVVGFEVACRLGNLVFKSHYGRGWHSTSTIGVIAGAAACARLIGLDAPSTDHAIGIALAQSAGTRANFGSMAKALQIGFAARAAVSSVRLAARGFTAGTDALTGPYGFSRLYGDGESDPNLFAPMGRKDSLAVESIGVIVKKYPMCYAAHRAVDAAISLQNEFGLAPDNIVAIDVESSAATLGPLIHHRPKIATEALFSMEYGVAAALLDGQIGCTSFTDDAVNRPPIATLIEKVTSRDVEGPILPPWSRVSVKTRDGRQLDRRVDVLRGSPDLPLTDEEIVAKLKDCLAYAGSDGDAEAIVDAIMALDKITLPALVRGAAWQRLRLNHTESVAT